MKKYFVFAIAALVSLAACTKVENNALENAPDVEITFQTASYATKAAGDQFTGTSFGTYAWSTASQLAGNIFMDNETITLQGGVWKPSTAYFWPKTATVDFISYYPAGASYITVAQDAITYADYDVSANPTVDLLYADKAVGYGANVNEVTTTPATSYQGVPTFFRHALAKLSINAQLAYDRKLVEDADGTFTVTKWAVKLTGANYSNLYYKGGLKLQLKSDASASPKVVGWDVLDGDDNVLAAEAKKVWTSNNGAKSASAALTISNEGVLTTDAAQTMLDGVYVLPQTLANVAGSQGMSFNFTIKTFRKSGFATRELAEAYLNEDIDFDSDVNIFLAENGTATAYFKTSEITAFEMAHKYVFNLNFTPTKGSGIDPNNPSNPVDPDDPNLDDVTITFDPAVEGWQTVNASATLYI